MPPPVASRTYLLRAVGDFWGLFTTPVTPHRENTAFGGFGVAAIATVISDRATAVLVGASITASVLPHRPPILLPWLPPLPRPPLAPSVAYIA